MDVEAKVHHCLDLRRCRETDGFYEIGLRQRAVIPNCSKLVNLYTCVLNLSSVTLSKDGQYAFYFAEDAQHPWTCG